MSKKQAVLIIHGIGEQKPMDTLRDFVTAVWTSDESIHGVNAGENLWSKPDTLSGSYELRKLTTSQNKNGVRTDFYEFYWAHMMEGTTYGHVFAWARTLLLRRPGTVPKQLRPAYWLLLFLSAASFLLFVYFAYLQKDDAGALPKWVSGLGSLFLLPLIGFIVLRIVGDAARYLHVAPDNIKSRHAIREAGVDILKKLHDPKREYGRIVLVGHSLGSVIGYDILTHAWESFHAEHDKGAKTPPTLDRLETLAESKSKCSGRIQARQRMYHSELSQCGCRWLVTDFVTMGSPLSHAAILLAHDLDDLNLKQRQREFPTCLPTLEVAKRDHRTVSRFSFEADRDDPKSYRIPHHAAVFGPTRWTNLYFPNSWILWGDIIGGPLRDVMGSGVRDVKVTTGRRGDLLPHGSYWTQFKGSKNTHVDELRKAVNLLDNR